MKLKIKNTKKHSDKYFSLILEKPQGFYFYPGQYLDIKLPVKDPNGDTRAFTISSSPTEDFLMVTVKKGLSPFKKYMEQLTPDNMIETTHPAGTFTLDESTPAIFFAGGVGITPFRSMLKYATDNQIHTPVTLIYSNSSENFLFKEELDSWQAQIKNCTIHYINTSIQSRLNKEKLQKLYPYPLPPIYYLAGSHSFVNNVAQMIKNLGIDEINIRYDRFDGYL